VIAFLRQLWSRRRVNRRSSTVQAAPPDWRVAVRQRTLVAAIMLGCWAVAIETRLVYLQVIDHGDLVDRADRQQKQTMKPPAKRGEILDRRGRVLATSADADTIYAVPSSIGDEVELVAKVCAALGNCSGKERQEMVERLRRQRHFAYIRRQESPEQAKKVADLNLSGIGFVKESRRFYPNQDLAAHLLGFVGLDNKGLSGLEAAYDAQIRGKEGEILVHTDARQHVFSRFERPPTTGSTIELTIDEYLQHVAERELHAGVLAHRAEGGSVVVMNPRTGEILAMANEPTFNPNSYREFAEPMRRNRAVQDLYEPGSTFKIVTASAAIEDKVMPIDTMIDTNPGYIRIGNSTVDEYDGHNYHVLSFKDVLVKSSNVGAIKIGFKVGTERLSRFVTLFGFGQRVSPDFPGENPGIVWKPEQWTERALASVSMGYQVAVTPLQIVAAFSSVANGGEYVEPRVVRAVYRDGRRYSVTPRVVRRTISRDTAATLTAIMEEVVEVGTAKSARIPGFSIAGKTGTASKLIDKRYSNSDNNVSFAGFLPSRNPEVAIIVMIDAPHLGGRSGGVVAAPIFKNIAEATLRYLGISPTISPDPPVLVKHRQTPEIRPKQIATEAPAAVEVIVDGPAGTMPDVRGMSARDAMRKLARLGLSPTLQGDGLVLSQTPQPGDPIADGPACRLLLGREPVRRTASAAQP
jgi:cell division protein FtsI (penicillin-binding protein 3)